MGMPTVFVRIVLGTTVFQAAALHELICLIAVLYGHANGGRWGR